MKKILQQILDGLGLEYSDITEEKSDDNIRLNIDTDNPKDFIGRSGDVLRAIQHLLRVILWKENMPGFVVVDVDFYRKKQEENVRNMAKGEAEKVLESGMDIELPEMASDKRRVVHSLITEEFPKLTTESVGSGDGRRVKIMVKK